MSNRPVLPFLSKPSTIAAAPTAISTKPATTRRRSDDSGSATSSRSAATGGIREARLAGRYAATIVTTSPTTYDATTVRGSRLKDARLRSRPIVPKKACRPRASR